MDVRRVLSEMIEAEMTYDVSVTVNGDELNFNVHVSDILEKVTFSASDHSVTLVNSDEFEEMKSRIDELEAELEAIKK